MKGDSLSDLLWRNRAEIFNRVRTQRNFTITLPYLGAGKVVSSARDQLEYRWFYAVKSWEVSRIVHRWAVQSRTVFKT